MIVLDSSTLILLAKSELIDMFIDCFAECYIPETVFKEATINLEKFDSQLIKKRVEEGRIKIRKPTKELAVQENINVFNIEKGEAESITLAIEIKSPLAVDDGKAIKAAKIFGITYITALSFVLLLLEKKKITKEQAIKTIRKLAMYGRYSRNILDAAAEEVDKYE